MSHFSVIVVTDEKPTEETLEQILAPWHEFECTGRDDSHVQEVDITNEARETFEKDTTPVIILADGEERTLFLNGNYRDEFCKPGQFGSHEESLPAGATKVQRPSKDYMTLVEFVADYYGKKVVPFGQQPDLSSGSDEGGHKYGYVLVDENGELTKVVRRTNPNAKWDWWVVGGRYAGKFVNEEDREVDVCQVKNLQLDKMRAEIKKNLLARLETGLAKLASREDNPIGREEALAIWRASAEAKPTYDELYEQWKIYWQELVDKDAGLRYADWLEKLHADHPFVIARAAGVVATIGESMFGGVGCPDQEPDPYAWIEGRPALTCFAFVKDGQWCERGEMGWWAMVSNEKDPGEWEQQVDALVSGLRPEQWVTVVDCHI